MNYELRVKIKLANGYRINSEEKEVILVSFPDGSYLKLRTPADKIRDTDIAIIRGGPFNSYEQASQAAKLAKLSLLCWAVEQRLGIDFGDGYKRGGLTEYGIATYQKQFRRPVRYDLHGIDIFESKENLVFIGLEGDIEVAKNPKPLVEIFEREFKTERDLSDKQILACEIYSASFFDISPRSRFITLVTAVEALLELARRSESIQSLVEDMVNMAKTLDDSIKNSIISRLKELKKESISEAGRSISHRLLPDNRYSGRPSWEFFKYIYNFRSEIVHTGKIKDASVDMLDLANETEQYVFELLTASLREGA